MLCQYCEQNRIAMKRRPLCKECYQFLHKESKLDLFPLIDAPELFKQSLTNKYGKDIINEFDELINSENKGLVTIANKYGFSRERARQLFEKLYGFHYTIIKHKRMEIRKERIEKEGQLKKDPTSKVLRYNVNGNVYKAAVAEKKVFDICAKIGYEIKPFLKSRAIDLVINGWNVDVKSAYKGVLANNGAKTPIFHFNMSKIQLKTAHFIICYAEPINKFFIIPKDQFPKGRAIFIPARETSEWLLQGHLRNSKNRYYTYLEAWHLLDRKENKEIIFSQPKSPYA